MAGGRVELVSLTKRFTDIAVDSIDLAIGFLTMHNETEFQVFPNRQVGEDVPALRDVGQAVCYAGISREFC